TKNPAACNNAYGAGVHVKTVLYINATGEISGAERSLLAILDALDRQQWHPIVAAPDGPLLEAVAKRQIKTIPIRLHPLQRPRSIRHGAQFFSALQYNRRATSAVIQHVNADIVHANSTPAMLCSAGTTYLPLIWQVRDLVPLGIIGMLLYRQATRVAVISSAVRDDIVRYAHDGGTKIYNLPPAVDTTVFAPAQDKRVLRERLGLPLDTFLIGHIAQFVPWKRHDLFLDAMTRVVSLPCHAVLSGANLSGDTTYLSHLSDRISTPPLSGHVTLLPWQDNAATLTAALDLSVLTSHNEPFGRVLIEALSCKVPAIAVDEGGARDIVLHDICGLLVPADHDALATAITRCMQSSELCMRYGSAGHSRVIENFGLDRQRSYVNALYGNI
ncbi:MAG TPA: glycosyltransferase family 4 protein, partial [Armatimonadota bacterium]|nr:glycosyltransferase family 4 protein [Armatimonadota bacterium]